MFPTLKGYCTVNFTAKFVLIFHLAKTLREYLLKVNPGRHTTCRGNNKNKQRAFQAPIFISYYTSSISLCSFLHCRLSIPRPPAPRQVAERMVSGLQEVFLPYFISFYFVHITSVVLI